MNVAERLLGIGVGSGVGLGVGFGVGLFTLHMSGLFSRHDNNSSNTILWSWRRGGTLAAAARVQRVGRRVTRRVVIGTRSITHNNKVFTPTCVVLITGQLEPIIKKLISDQRHARGAVASGDAHIAQDKYVLHAAPGSGVGAYQQDYTSLEQRTDENDFFKHWLARASAVWA
jgi:hypothetical protein